jgi:hypothetical protein
MSAEPPPERFESLTEAQRAPGVFVILEGDWGGQIYLTAPAAAIRCDERSLRRLLRDLDRVAWQSNGGDGAGIRYERHPDRSSLAAGMGGAAVFADSLWLHPRLDDLGIAAKIIGVLVGQRSALDDLSWTIRPRFDGAYGGCTLALRLAADGSLELNGEAFGAWAQDEQDGGISIELGDAQIMAVMSYGDLYLLLDNSDPGALRPGGEPVLLRFVPDPPIDSPDQPAG